MCTQEPSLVCSVPYTKIRKKIYMEKNLWTQSTLWNKNLTSRVVIYWKAKEN